MRLVVHLGLHRSGSTAIQDWLLAERSGWEADGTFVHARPSSGGTPSPFAILARTASSRAAQSGVAGFLAAALAEFSERFSSGIISDENLLGAMPGPRTGFASRGDHLCAVLGKLAEKHTITPVIVLREHVDWLRSLYRTYLSRGGIRTFPEFCSAIPASALRFAPLLERLARSGELAVYDQQSLAADHGRGFMAQVAARLGTASTLHELPRRNAAFADLHLRIASRLGRHHAVLAGHGGTAMTEAAAAGDCGRLASIVAERAVKVNWKATPAARMRRAGRFYRDGIPEDRRLSLAQCRVIVAEAQALGPLNLSPERLPLDEFAADRQSVAQRWLPNWRM